MAMALEQWSILRRWTDFARLSAGTAVSAIGTSISAVAIPLTAVLVLDPTPTVIGLRATFAVAGVLAVVGLTIALCSPLRTFHGLPEPIG